MTSDGAAEAIERAVTANTKAVGRVADEVRLLREALCGTSTDPKPGGAIGEVGNVAVAERFYGRGHSNTAGRPV